MAITAAATGSSGAIKARSSKTVLFMIVFLRVQVFIIGVKGHAVFLVVGFALSGVRSQIFDAADEKVSA